MKTFLKFLSMRRKHPGFWAALGAVWFCAVALSACGTAPAEAPGAAGTQPESALSLPEEPSPEPPGPLTLEELVQMALETGGKLRWEDLEGFSYEDESRAPFVCRRYALEEDLSLLVRGSRGVGEEPSGEPAFLSLYDGPYDCNSINVRWLAAGLDAPEFAQLTEEEAAGLIVSQLRAHQDAVVPVDVLRNAPSLYVGDAGGSLEALMYCGEHYYDISAYTEYGNIGGGGGIIPPLDERVQALHPNVLRREADSRVSLLFDVETVPDQVTVRCWPEDSWGEVEREGEDIPAAYQESFSFPLKNGSYIYDITATWDHRDLPENYWWTAHYILLGDTASGLEG